MKSRVLLLAAALLPAVAAYAILFVQVSSAPYQDDYRAILAFAADYQRLPNVKQKILAIATEQYNEYKLGFEHSVVAAELQLTRHLNFLLLSVLGDLALLPIAYLLWLVYQVPESDQAGRLRAFLPISFLFFALTYWETLDWAMTGLQNVPVVLFSLLAIYFLIPDRASASSGTRFTLACLTAAFAAFTSANGFLLGPVGLLILLPRRAYARALFWCLSFVVPLAAYLYRLVPMPHALTRSSNITRPLFFFAFLGGFVPSPWFAALAGLVIVGIMGLAVRSRYDQCNPVAFYFSLWILLTAGVVAWVRGAAGVAVVSRYGMYSLLLLIFCYAFLSHHLAIRSPAGIRKGFYATALVAAIAFCVAVDVHAYQKLGERRRMVLAGMELYRANPAVNSPMIDPRIMIATPSEQAYERGMLTEAIKRGIYSLGCTGCRQER